MHRRKFIILSSLGSAVLTFPFLHCASRNPQWEKVISRPITMASLCDAHTLEDIGKAYVQQMPEEAKPSTLFGYLTADAAGQRINSAPALSGKLEEKIQQDFNKGNIVIIKGWVLSRTEARQCAYFYLLAKS